MKVNIADLQSVSAFTLSTAEAIVLPIPESPLGAGPDIRLTSVENVLYLPGILEAGQSIPVINDGCVPEETLDRWSLDFLKRQSREARYADRSDGEIQPEVIDATVCILGNLFSRNFGHWTEELLKVAILEHARVDCCYVMPMLPSFARASLAFLQIDDRRILTVESPAVLTRVLFSTAVHHGNIAEYPHVLSLLRDTVAARLGERRTRFGRRLWLERGAAIRSGGVTANKSEVYPLLESHGFDIVDMAGLSVADQFAAARDAIVLAGPHGSQFVHAQFMPPSSTVIECFSPVHVNPSILQICRVLGHSYHQVVARSHLVSPYGHGRDCEVDCEHLRLVLDRLQ